MIGTFVMKKLTDIILLVIRIYTEFSEIENQCRVNQEVGRSNHRGSPKAEKKLKEIRNCFKNPGYSRNLKILLFLRWYSESIQLNCIA